MYGDLRKSIRIQEDNNVFYVIRQQLVRVFHQRFQTPRN